MANKNKPEGTGIIFSTGMARALAEGKKKQTRRIVKGIVPSNAVKAEYIGLRTFSWMDESDQHSGDAFDCPFGIIGDMLYVREDFQVSPFYDKMPPVKVPEGSRVRYLADREPSGQLWGRKRENMYMPRWMSRLTLELVDVRIERLQEISDEDCYAEGITEHQVDVAKSYIDCHPFLCSPLLRGRTPPRWAYAKLWEELHGAGSWQTNPFLWVLSFTIYHANVDSFLQERAQSDV